DVVRRFHEPFVQDPGGDDDLVDRTRLEGVDDPSVARRRRVDRADLVWVEGWRARGREQLARAGVEHHYHSALRVGPLRAGGQPARGIQTPRLVENSDARQAKGADP